MALQARGPPLDNNFHLAIINRVFGNAVHARPRKRERERERERDGCAEQGAVSADDYSEDVYACVSEYSGVFVP